ncbi:hypothetical protein [Microvirga solisilvae]|uniref:hypothetical protein n=1 Tax=Microvirga solisilvae TaxID=2919498 RepID=UPI001FAEE144|nr:hypothetical protein [Microvirga solisilvae]
MVRLLSHNPLLRQRPVEGWILSKLIACDEAFPSTLRRYITASPLRAQLIALVLCELDLARPDLLASRLHSLSSLTGLAFTNPLAPIAYTILHRRVRDIVRHLYPTSEGLVGILSKIGDEPLSEENYRLMIELHTKPQHRARLSALRYMPRVPARAFAILMALEPPYVSMKLVKQLASVHQAKDFLCSIELIKRVVPTASDGVLIASLESMEAGSNLGSWVQRWLERASHLWVEPPSLNSAEFTLLANADAMRDAGRRFENCLETKVAFVALGRTLFVEYRPHPCIIELESLDSGWVFHAIHGKSNLPVSPSITRQVLKKLHSAGIRIPARHFRAAHYNRVARLASIYDFSRDDFGVIDEDDELADKLAFDASYAA